VASYPGGYPAAPIPRV